MITEEEQIIDTGPKHTEQIQDIIGTPPNWLYRWGISIVLLVAGLCVFIASKVSYPETVRAVITLHALNSTAHVLARDSGEITRLLVADGLQVNAGTALIVTKSDSGSMVLKAPITGRVNYEEILHEHASITAGERLFSIDASDKGFYGELDIHGKDRYKVTAGQVVLIKIRSVGKEQANLKGTVKYILNHPTVNSDYIAEVDFDERHLNQNGHMLLHNGLKTDADVIIANATVLSRLMQSLIRIK